MGRLREATPRLAPRLAGTLVADVQAIGAGRRGHTLPFDLAFHRVLPDPALSLAFCCRREAGGYPLEPRLVIVGPKSKPSLCMFEPGYEMAAVRLKLEWVAPLLDLVPSEHEGAVTDLSLMLAGFAEPLFGKLLETRIPERAVAMLAAALVQRRHRDPACE
ncbi:MAG: hypothetical protein H0W33_09150, partial [Gammaproteobacteria bacterium]|nr:hypothetical protein [Gammaproteobacteria bacterium]